MTWTDRARKHALGIFIGSATMSLLVAPNYSAAVDEASALRLLANALNDVKDPAIQKSLLEGILSGLAGRRDVPPPDAWPKIAAKLDAGGDEGVRDLASQLSQLFGDESATQRALKMVVDRAVKLPARRRALHSLLEQKNGEVVGHLESLLDEPAMRIDAIRGFAAIENARASELLLERYKSWPDASRKAAIETLATRKLYAEQLLEAIKSNRIPRSDIPSHVARSLHFLLGDTFEKVFGEVRELDQDRNTLINKYKELITEDALANADLLRGRAVFKKTCASCHTLYGTGGKIGPDLTGSNRANLDYLLLNSVDPSYDVPESYKMVVIQTEDGRVLNGVIAEEDAQRVILKTVEQPKVIVLKSDIVRRKISPKSMMPDGQLEKMRPQEIIDLIGYLQTIEQVGVTP